MCLPDLFGGGEAPSIIIPPAPKAPPPPPPESPLLPMMRADVGDQKPRRTARDTLKASPTGVSIGLPKMTNATLGGTSV
jgi:hypothetical protein